jgi:acyl-CoA synthetase (AMP-forming)/AMP-acid ligase II
MTLDLKALYPEMGRLLGTTRLKTLVVGNVAEMSPTPAALRGHMLKNGEIVPVPHDSEHIAFDELLNNDGRYTAHPPADPRESVAVLQYTGGTTGLPKGAMLTHANLSSATAQYVETTHTCGCGSLIDVCHKISYRNPISAAGRIEPSNRGPLQYARVSEVSAPAVHRVLW